MTDMIPDKSKRIAYSIGLVFHPAVLAILTLLLILKELPISQTLFWTALISGIILIPTFMMIAYLRYRDRHTYQRDTRGSIYSVAWLSVVICFVLILLLEGPREIAVCMAALAVWLPLQSIVNHKITKISAHTAVASGCFTALLLFGKLNSLAIMIGILIILLIAWARLQTKNHTMLQVVLGVLVAGGSVLIVFPLMLMNLPINLAI